MFLPIGVIGNFSPAENGCAYVKIIDDSENTGGYLILFANSRDFNSGVGFDNWVENRDSLVNYFTEANWQIDWDTGDSE